MDRTAIKASAPRRRNTGLAVLLAVLLLAAVQSAQAQHYIGVRAGAGSGTARFEPRREMRLLPGYNPTWGISWKYYSPQLGVGGLQADLLYVTKGYRELYDRDNTVTDREIYRKERRRTIRTIELPLFWQIHAYAFQRRVRAYLNAGVYACYMIGSQESDGEFGDEPQWTDYPISSVRDNPFGYGLAAGVGVSVLFGRMEAFVEGRYAFGFSDVLKSRTKYPLNTATRSPVDMMNVSVGLYYRLGKAGILAPPQGSGRPSESWDSIPVGRNREQAAPGNTTGPQPPAPNR